MFTKLCDQNKVYKNLLGGEWVCLLYTSVGVDGCGKKLYPTQKAVESLKIIAQVISTFLLKKNTREKLDQAYQMTQTVLDQIDLWAYVIDPDTYELLYINQKTEQLVPDAKLGEFCYDVFQRRETPCPGCPLLELSAGQLQTCLLYTSRCV